MPRIRKALRIILLETKMALDESPKKDRFDTAVSSLSGVRHMGYEANVK